MCLRHNTDLFAGKTTELPVLLSNITRTDLIWHMKPQFLNLRVTSAQQDRRRPGREAKSLGQYWPLQAKSGTAPGHIPSHYGQDDGRQVSSWVVTSVVISKVSLSSKGLKVLFRSCVRRTNQTLWSFFHGWCETSQTPSPVVTLILPLIRQPFQSTPREIKLCD